MPYPTYKDACAPWLGDVPEQWGVLRQRNTVTMLVSNIDKLTVEGELPVRLCNYVDVYKNDRITASLSFMHATATTDEVERFRLQFGDVLITKDSESWTDIGVPALVEYTAPDLVCGYHLAILRPREGVLDGRYLLRALQSQGVAVQFRMSANGVTRYGLSHDAIKSVLLPIPPLPEQVGIVRFLDHADLRIRRSIVAKKKLIALLNEQKQAIIQRAVTRGLDPYIGFQASGVDWLGEVPEQWQVWQVGHFAQVGNGSTPSRGNAAYWNKGTHPWLNSSSVNQSPISGADQFVTDVALRECHLPRVQPGSVLVAITGQGKTRGTAALLTVEATINQHIAFITPRRDVALPEYLHLALVGAYRELRRISDGSGSTKGALTCGDISHFKVAVPPRDEQGHIVTRIERETHDVQVAIARTELEINLLHEYRTRLIADVATGKLDVREAAAQLPDEVEEPEPLDGVDALAESDESEGEADLDTAAGEAEP